MAHSEKLGLGTVQFGLNYGISNTGGQTSQEEVSRILAVALQNNVTMLDTASAYGSAEEVLGKSNISGFNIVSKFMTPITGETITMQLHRSLEKLKQDSLYGYLAHRPGELADNTSIWDELIHLKASGIIEKIGFSLNTVEELEALLDKHMVPDLIQVPYNYLDNRFEKLMIELHENGCEIHTRSAFLQGLFFRDTETLPVFFDEVKLIITQLQKNSSLSGSLLKYVLDKPFVDKVIIGVENVEQLEQNLKEIDSAQPLPELEYGFSENILMPMHWPKA